MINENFIYIGLFLAAVGELSYLWETIKGNVKPNRITWFLWAFAPLIAFAAQISQGVGTEAWLTFIIGFIPLLTFIATFFNKNAYWKVSKTDLIFGGLSILGLILWQITGIGNIAIFFSILADAMASAPTVIKSYHHPETESPVVYEIVTISSIITLLTIQNWNFQNSAFAVWLIIICGLLAILIRFELGKKIDLLLKNRK